MMSIPVVAASIAERPAGFHLATVIFRRTAQLRVGARPRVDAEGHKLAHVAFLEVTAGMIGWDVAHS
jgi:DNA-directed RNA polymerase subunit K/omega